MNATKGAVVTLADLAKEDLKRSNQRSAAKANAKMRKGH